jgi:transglutaminase-like putative cysteine protease
MLVQQRIAARGGRFMARHRSLVVLASLALGSGLLGAEPPRPIAEFHEAALVDGARAGTLHTTVVAHDTPGKQVRVLSRLDLTLRRYGAVVRLRMDQGSVETPQGKVLAVFMRQQQAGGRHLALDGVVIDDDKLDVKVDNGRLERRVRWSPEVVGIVQQERLFARKKPKPGDRFTFLRYEPIYNTVLTVRAVVMKPETVDVLGTKRRLLRVELTPDRIEVPGHAVKPARAVWWLDDSFVPLRKQTELDGLGTLVLVRTTKEKAQSAVTAAPDVGRRSLIPLDRAIPRPYDTRSVLYRVTLRDEDDAAAAFVRDGHQEARGNKGNTFELLVHPVRVGKSGTEKAGPEHLAPSHYIDHGDARVRELARRAVGAETDNWKKALRIERFVKNHLGNDNSADLVPASRVAQSLRGDCRHHALLTAALCRAAGLPSRTAIGLLYVYNGGPKLGFHMWAEVLVDGQWLGLDSTLGKGGVSAAHVKITQHSWHEVQSLTPLLPVARVMGKLRMEVLSSK